MKGAERGENMDKVIDNTTGFHFTIVDNYILSNANLNAMEQIVYVHLKKYSVQSNKCFPGINKLAESVDSSPNTIRKTLKSLKVKGFIDIQQRFNASNEYTLLPYPQFVEEIKETSNMEQQERGIGAVLEVYQNNVNPVYGSMEREKLLAWVDTFQGKGEIVIKAVELSVLQGVRKIKYIESILLSWHQAGIKSMEQCEAYQKEWEDKRRGNKNGNGSSIENNESDKERRYDFSKFGDLRM